MMDFTGVKAVTIPEGSVKKITVNSSLVWEKPEDTQCTMILTDNSGQFGTIISGSYASITLGSVSIKNTGTYTAQKGDVLTIAALKTGNRSAVIVNGTTVVSQTSSKFTYSYTLAGNIAFVFDMRTISGLTTSVYEITSV